MRISRIRNPKMRILKRKCPLILKTADGAGDRREDLEKKVANGKKK
jgi:hypothetical protein